MIKNIYFKVALIFIFIWSVGFGVMHHFWCVLPRDYNLYGLYHYRAATIGDGFFLPLLVASLSFYILKSHQDNEIKLQKKCITMNYIISCSAAILGLLWQLQWLSNENITLNWTIPRAGYFNIAGVYHAFFFVFMFYIITFLLIRVLLIRNYLVCKCKEPHEILSFFLVWFSGSGFLFMIGLDDLSSSFEAFTILIGIYLTFILIFTLVNIASIKRFNYMDFICILAGSTASLGIGLVTIEREIVMENILLITALSLFSLAYIIIDVKKISRTVAYSFIIITTVFLINFGMASIQANWIFTSISIITPVLIATGQLFTQEIKKLVQEFVVQGLVLNILVIAPTLVYNYMPENFESISETVVGIIIGAFLSTAVKKTFEFVKTEEKKRNLDRRDENQIQSLRNVKIACYSSIIILALGGFIYLFLTLYNMAEISHYSLFEFNITSDNRLYLFLTSFLISTVLLVCQKNIRKLNYKGLRIMIFTITCIIAYITLFLSLLHLRSPFAIDLNLTNLFLIFMSIGSSLMVAESFYSNVIKVRGYTTEEYHRVITLKKENYDAWSIVTAIIIFFGNLLIICVSLLPSGCAKNEVSASLVYTFIGIFGFLCATIVLPVLSAKIIKLDEIPGVATASAIGGVLQSGFLVSVIIMLGGVTPVFIRSVIEDQFNYWFGILMIITYVYWPLAYCLKNNIEHLEEQSSIYLENKNNVTLKKQYDGLKAHIKFQNMITMTALLLYSLVPLVVLYIIYTLEGKSNEFLRDFWPTD
ncbi:MAG: hypothetical protein FWE07_02400 [Turicibacter sp.]|nr:hypothetical protein [Turicibacter sp.]